MFADDAGEMCELPLRAQERTLYQDEATIQRIVRSARVIAVVGLSANPRRPSNEVARYLQRQGLRIVPVNPNITEALGERKASIAARRPIPSSTRRRCLPASCGTARDRRRRCRDWREGALAPAWRYQPRGRGERPPRGAGCRDGSLPEGRVDAQRRHDSQRGYHALRR